MDACVACLNYEHFYLKIVFEEVGRDELLSSSSWVQLGGVGGQPRGGRVEICSAVGCFSGLSQDYDQHLLVQT